MIIDNVGKAGVSQAASVAPVASKKRQAEYDALQTATIGALKNDFREFDVALLVSGAMKQASEDLFFPSWERMIDRVVYYFRIASKDLGVALCDAAERAIPVQAKQLKLVSADYQPRPRD
jgi:hypothetical protein